MHRPLLLVTVSAVLTAVALTAVGGGAPRASGPDVVVRDLWETALWGSSGDLTAYSLGTDACNRGDEPVSWVSSTPEHPVIAQNMYRLTDRRLEQIGMAWPKHGFASINQDQVCGTCVIPPLGSAQLGVGCSDPYWASTNGDPNFLGPRHEINAFTGEFPFPHTLPNGDPTLRGRLQVATDEVDPASNPGVAYFLEAHYVTADDAAAGNGENNVSHRPVTVLPDLELELADATFESAPAITAWSRLDPEVTVQTVRIPAEGLFYVAHKVADNGDGTWHYEYAVYNLNSHRSARSLTVPSATTNVTGIGFRDVPYHSGEPYDGTDWTPTVDGGAGTISFSTDSYASNANANALRWGTLYNFWFDADQPPLPAMATLRLFRPGSPSSVDFVTVGPGDDSLLFADGFESGTTGAWSGAGPSATAAAAASDRAKPTPP